MRRAVAARTGLPGVVGALALVATLGAHSGQAAAETAAVATADSYATTAATRALAAGGNAVDATVAAAFTLAVTYPEAGNLGGGGFATLVMRGKPAFLDFRERAPARATATMYLDHDGNVIPGASTIGATAVAVPGTVAGLWELHRRYGRLPWKADMRAAIAVARRGFPIDHMLAATIADRAPALAGHTNFQRYFGHLHEGDVLRQPELAATLERIATGGRSGFDRGPTAVRLEAEVRRGGGILTRRDLAAYRPVWRTPLEGSWSGFGVITAPLPSSGGIALLSLLAMKSDRSDAFVGVAPNSTQYVHLLAELEKRVFADRADYFGDPDYVTAPVDALLAPTYLARRAAEISLDRPTPTDAVTPGLGPHHNTTHFSIVDAAGNAVSLTYTLNDDFGSGLVVSGAGFLLNNEMDDFSAKPGVANLFGVVGGEANAIAPGKRPLSTMTPTILTRDGHVAAVIGTPGGSRIATSIVQVLTNWRDFGMSPWAAVAAARIHHQLVPVDLLYEEPYAQLAPTVKAELGARGYRFENQGWDGDIQFVVLGTEPRAIADPRGRGVAVVLR